jgi:hypothetical protein
MTEGLLGIPRLASHGVVLIKAEFDSEIPVRVLPQTTNDLTSILSSLYNPITSDQAVNVSISGKKLTINTAIEETIGINPGLNTIVPGRSEASGGDEDLAFYFAIFSPAMIEVRNESGTILPFAKNFDEKVEDKIQEFDEKYSLDVGSGIRLSNLTMRYAVQSGFFTSAQPRFLSVSDFIFEGYTQSGSIDEQQFKQSVMSNLDGLTIRKNTSRFHPHSLIDYDDNPIRVYDNTVQVNISDYYADPTMFRRVKMRGIVTAIEDALNSSSSGAGQILMHSNNSFV